MKTIAIYFLLTISVLAQEPQNLAEAVERVWPNKILEFLKKGEDPNLLVKNQPAVIYLADLSGVGTSESLVYLIQYNAKLDIKNKYGVPLITYLIIQGHKLAAIEAIREGVELNITGPHIDPPLYAASQLAKEGADLVKEMLEKGANPNIQTFYSKCTPLHNAVLINDIKIVQMLVDHGADVNIKNSNLQTPLFSAVSSGYIDIVKVLLGAGAKTGLKDSSGKTVLKIAQEDQRAEIIELLKKSKK